MKKISLNEVKTHLNSLMKLRDENDAMTEVKLFLNWVWEEQIEASSNSVEILKDLAMDLEHFSPKEKDEPFFGLNKLARKIEDVLPKLN